MAVLNRTNIVATPQRELKEGVLFELESTNALSFLSDLSEQTKKDISRESLGWCLSFLQIDSDAAEKAVDYASLSLSDEPVISLIQAHSSTSEE